MITATFVPTIPTLIPMRDLYPGQLAVVQDPVVDGYNGMVVLRAIDRNLILGKPSTKSPYGLDSWNTDCPVLVRVATDHDSLTLTFNKRF